MAVIGNAPALGIITGDNILDGSIKAADLAPGAAVPSQTGNSGKYLTTDGTNSSWGALSVVKITSIDYAGDDLAADPAGGQTITVTGSGFVDTPTVYVNDTIAPSVSFVSSTEITFTTPAKTAGTYNLYVINTDGSTAIKVMGISYSGVPAWTTAAGSLGSLDVPLSFQLEATSNSTVTYTLSSGSSLPSGITLSSTGLIEGTVDTEQTFSFSVDAIDEESQETPRSFSITVSLADPYFEYVTMLLSGDGTNAAQNNTFVDGSTNNFTLTRNGNITQGTFSPFGDNWSNYFGSANFFSAPSNAAFAFGTGDFTVEAWVHPTSAYTTFNYVLGVAATGGLVLYVAGGYLALRAYGVSDILVSSSTPVVNTWSHVAVVRSGSTITLYLNGVSVASTTSTYNFAQGAAYAGNDSTNAAPWLGYISNLRAVKGSAVYTSSFTPSKTPLTAISGTSLLTCQSNRFIDAGTANSGAPFPLTLSGSPSVQRFNPFGTSTAYSAATIGGSGYFDGTGDYLNFAGDAAFAFGANNFTLEAWIYPSSTTNYRCIFTTRGSAASSVWFGLDTGDMFPMLYNSGTVVKSSIATPLYTWSHVAVVRQSGVAKIYVNGVNAGSVSDGVNYTATNCVIGNDTVNGPFPWSGYISNLRVVKGTAVYTSAFTPSTTPLTAVSGTSLLCSFANGAIYDNAMMNDLETVGNAQISTSVKKYGTGSMYFDGSGDWLYDAAGLPNFGTGDLTVEMWVYRNTASNGALVRSGGSTISGSLGQWMLYFESSSPARMYWMDIVGSSNKWGVSTTSFPTGTWVHVAVVRQSGVWKVFFDGISQAATVGTFTDTTNYSNAQLSVGGNFTSYNFNGYIDDLRITNGYARYTANFTPPESALKAK